MELPVPDIDDISHDQLRQILELQRDLLGIVAGTGPIRGRIDDACRRFEQAVPNAVASVMKLDANGRLQVFSAPSIPGKIACQLNNLEPGPGAGSCGNAVYRAQPVFVEDTLRDARWQDLRTLAIDNQLKACWSMPLFDPGGGVAGTFALTSLTHGLPNLLQRQILELGAATIRLLLEQEQEERARHDREAEIRRLSDFNALLASVTELTGTADSEDHLLQSICDLAIVHADLCLAWVGHPGKDGLFEVLAASGDALGYLDGIVISTDDRLPEGQGPSAQCWREGTSRYNTSFAGTDSLSPWHERAERFGIVSSATVPIYRAGRIWATMTVYHHQAEVFDSNLQSVLETLALNISRGLDRLDLVNQERQARKSQTLLANALSSVEEGVVITDPDQTIVFVNNAFEKLTGYRFGEVRGRNCNLLQGPDTDPEIRTLISETLRDHQPFSGEILNYRRDGSSFWNLLTINPLRAASGEITHFVGVQRDITDLRSLNAQLEYQAFHDALTGLPNRRALDIHLNEAISRADRRGRVLALGIVDLDDFKPVNDRFGHSAGDQLLKEVSSRLNRVLLPDEYIARIGGDEFVVVFEDLDGTDYENELQAITTRLHEVVATPLELAPGKNIYIELSMGLALHPSDAQDGGVLMRLADGALYQAKQHKHDRTQWWTLHGDDTTTSLETEDSLDPYGPGAAQVLGAIEGQLEKVAGDFIDRFYGNPHKEPALRAVLDWLSDHELDAFKQNLMSHLCLVLGSETSFQALEESSRRLGHVYSLTGVDGVMLLQVMSLYRELLSDHLNSQPMMARQRYRILQVAERRLQDDIQAQFTAQSRLHAQYVDYTVQPMPERLGTWSDAVAHEIGILGELPGIRGALLIRQSSQGVFKIEATAGTQAQGIAKVFRLSGIETNNTSLLPSNESLMSRAWHTGTAQSSPSHALERRSPAWDEFFERLANLGISSSTHVPVLNEFGHPVALLTLMGAYPNQFESAWFRQFARNLQQRWGEIWLRCTQPAPAVSQEQSIAFRQRLFNGGLRMHMQPIVDIRTGELIKVEALARLVTVDDKILGPGVFLPLLGDSELDRLFRMGLEQVLLQVVNWDAQGLAIDVSLNLPPRTLMDPECPIWVEEALRRHGVAPGRLTLELLEGQEIDVQAKDAAIGRLIDLGIKLAMDDLGSGFSSLHRLASVPFNTIKVDQGLLARIRLEPIRTLSLISTVIQMGVDFGRDVIVEGLEDEGMIEAARILGAHRGQGYGLARPMQPEKIPVWSKLFHLPTSSNRITTPLGALAYHWKATRHDHIHDCALEVCPLTRFLSDNGLDDTREARWHVEIHSLRDTRDASRQLLESLSETVRSQVR